ncbi:MAG: DUF488 domain-containing protein [Deltaproteobacteria bacterium]|nr:DUF488 domain-containing protein [Deltaproteobacteria bacterium]
MKDLYTIGHSTHPIDRFISHLTMHDINRVFDVRSDPYSRYNPQFNRENLQPELKGNGIVYVFLGKELGPRSDDPGCYKDGRVSSDRLAQTNRFQEGLKRVRQGMASYRVALMCSEKDPIACHRTILVCRHLRTEGMKIRHILEDGSLEENDSSIRRLIQLLKLPERDLFTTPDEMVERAYDIQGKKIAFVPKTGKSKPERKRGI